MNTFNHIELHIQDQVAAISLNRPEKHNALNTEMIAELTAAFQQINAGQNIRAALLRGYGPSFCAGADLNYMKSIAGFGEEENKQDALRLAQLFENIYTCPKPLIAVLHGAVFGGANGLSAACDLVLADEKTVFAFSEVKLGISPATISPYVIRRCGETAARELMLTGRRFTATEAERFQLVNKLTKPENREEILDTYIREFRSAAPTALAECKQMIRELGSENNATGPLMDYTASLIAKQRASAEGQEGMTAFFEKRKPKWNT